MEGVIEGRIVHYVPAADDQVFERARDAGRHLAAMIVRDTGSSVGVVNLLVYPDGSNDLCSDRDARWHVAPFWMTSVAFDAAGTPGTWHWPERA